VENSGSFFLDAATPEAMDTLWAEGWRHFGTFFFFEQFNEEDNRQLAIIPLRIVLDEFSFSKSQRKLLIRNQAIRVEFLPAFIDETREVMFYKHIQRFKKNIPYSLYDFLDENAANTPCNTLQCCLYQDNTLFAVSYFDVGAQSTSSVYAMFDPAFSELRPGIHTLLEEIKFAQALQKKYLYLGYAHQQSSFYDYKKRFNALQAYDWEGNWAAFQAV
jgi:arginine-tRNA-protein transferase